MQGFVDERGVFFLAFYTEIQDAPKNGKKTNLKQKFAS